MKQDRKPPRGAPDLREKAEARLQPETPGVHDLSHEEISILVHELQVHQIELEMQNDELRRGQISLEEANRKYSDFYDFAPVGFLTLDESGIIRELNLTAARQLGVARRHLADKPFRFSIAVEDRNRFRLYLKRVFQEPGPHPGEIKLQRPDGGSFSARIDSVAVTDISDARVCRTSITDISDLKQAEEKLQDSERLFASFVGHLPSVVVIRDLEGRCLFANAAWEQTFRKSREEWLGKTSEELWPPEVAAKFRQQDRLVIESGEALQTLGSLRHPDGLHQWISHRFPIVDQDGQPVMIGINAIDVTEPMAIKARLEQVLDSGPAAIYTCDPGRGFALSYISENTKTLVGWEAREFLADSRFWLQHVHPEDRPWVCKRLELPWPEDRQTFEYRFLAQDGAYRWMHDDVRLLRDADGKPVEITGLWMDITDSKRIEEALRVSLRFLELVHNFTDINSLLSAFVSEIKNYTGCDAVGIRVLDADGRIPYQAYEGFRQQFYESESPLSTLTDECMCIRVIKGEADPRLFFYTSAGSFYVNNTTRFLATVSDAEKGVTRNVCNQEGYESLALIPIRWGDQILGLIHIADRRENMVPLELVEMLEKAALQLGTAFERVKAEAARRESEAKYRLLVNQIPAVVFKGYQDWSVDFFDRKIEKLTGYPKAEFDSRQLKWCDLVHPEDLDMFRGAFKQALNNDKSYVREYRIRKKDGEIAWIQARGQIFCDVADQVEYVSGVFFDITARKVAETLIQQERQRFFSLLDMLPATVCLVAPDHTLPFANRQFREVFGGPQGRTCHELIHGKPMPCDECNLREILETRKPVEWERTSLEGRIYHVYNYPFADIDGSPMILKLGIDITSRKALEAQLLQAQKMEAVGRLAGGVAHDFNNLLMAIMGYSELIRTSLVREDPLYKYSDDILKATERAASLTQQLLAFSRRQVMQPQVLNLNRVVADLEKMLRRLIGEHIELEIVAGPELGAVKADPGQINQIIMNLAVNARDAMPKGGQLIMTTDNIEFTTSHKCHFEDLPSGRYVRLTVTDTGGGMDGETLDHIFEPFFTTKEVGKGTGLGLPMVYGIVKQNGGCVDVESRPGQGATFKIYLPRIEAAVEAPGARVSLAAKLEGSETILVVEDEDALRTLLCRFFRLYGYKVLEARHGGEALLTCERHPGPIHLMITDVVMPQMSGKELADRLVPLHPEMTVFFMSGYTDSDLSEYGAPESSQHFIPKPFRPMDLVKKVRDFLDASGGVKAQP
jgi:two-component system, cell cycle sensor histidine kinase and response regulator CckA